jgi:hypothetical protein
VDSNGAQGTAVGSRANSKVLLNWVAVPTVMEVLYAGRFSYSHRVSPQVYAG